jgi:hypothetical protein
MTLRTTRRDPGFALTERFLQYFTCTKVLVGNRTFMTVLFIYYYSAKGMVRAGRVKKMPTRAINWSIRAVKNKFKGVLRSYVYEECSSACLCRGFIGLRRKLGD